MSWLWKIGLSGLKWIGVNIGLPIIADLINKQMNKPKVIESAAPGELEEKCKAKAKEDGFDVE